MIVVQFLNAIIVLMSFSLIVGEGTFNKFEEITETFQKVFLHSYKVKSDSIIYDNLFAVGLPGTGETSSSSLYSFTSPLTPTKYESFLPLTINTLIIKLPTKYVFSYIVGNNIDIYLLNQDMSKEKELNVVMDEYKHSDSYLILIQNSEIGLIGYMDQKIKITVYYNYETTKSFEIEAVESSLEIENLQCQAITNNIICLFIQYNSESSGTSNIGWVIIDDDSFIKKASGTFETIIDRGYLKFSMINDNTGIVSYKMVDTKIYFLQIQNEIDSISLNLYSDIIHIFFEGDCLSNSKIIFTSINTDIIYFACKAKETTITIKKLEFKNADNKMQLDNSKQITIERSNVNLFTIVMMNQNEITLFMVESADNKEKIIYQVLDTPNCQDVTLNNNEGISTIEDVNIKFNEFTFYNDYFNKIPPSYFITFNENPPQGSIVFGKSEVVLNNKYDPSSTSFFYKFDKIHSTITFKYNVVKDNGFSKSCKITILGCYQSCASCKTEGNADDNKCLTCIEQYYKKKDDVNSNCYTGEQDGYLIYDEYYWKCGTNCLKCKTEDASDEQVEETKEESTGKAVEVNEKVSGQCSQKSLQYRRLTEPSFICIECFDNFLLYEKRCQEKCIGETYKLNKKCENDCPIQYQKKKR